MARKRDPNEFMDTFGAVRRRVGVVAGEAYSTLEIGSVQAKVFRHIGEHGPVSQAEVARAAVIDPTLTGRSITGLIERGWVRRERSATDRREYILDITAPGKRALEKVEKVRGQFLARINGALDDRDFDDFERIAKKILDALA